MLKEYLLAGLAGLGCGVVNGLYLVLVLYTASVVNRVWAKVLLLSWPLHVGGPPLLIIPFVMPLAAPHAGPAGRCFLLSWVVPFGGAVLWYRRTHPNPLKLGLRRRV